MLQRVVQNSGGFLNYRPPNRKGAFVEITPREMGVMRHSLGLDYQDSPYRNNFVAGPGHSDMPHLESLVSKGLMVKRRAPFDEVNESYVFYVTEEGRQKTMESHPNFVQQANAKM
jgi:hypothetical protein